MTGKVLRFRFFAWLGFLLLLGAVTLLSAWGLSLALERTVTYRYFDEALTELPENPLSIDWRANPALDRPVTEADQRELGRSLGEAWGLYAAALAHGNDQFLPDRFSGPSLARARHAVKAGLVASGAASPRPAPAMVVLHQSPRPVFHHLDGSVIVLEDRPLTLRYALDAEGGLSDLRLSRDQTLTVLMNESTGWHVFAHERRGTEAVVPRRATPSALRPAGPLPRLAGINYYPANTPWRRFWAEFDPQVVAADMERVKDLGGNALRIFLPRVDFLDPPRQARNLPRLKTLLDLAAAKGLRVVPVLFDMKSDYEPHLWPHDDALLRAVLPLLAASPAVVMVDLKNEPDLDYKTHGPGKVQAWLAAMAADARQIAPDLPLTIGFSAAGPAVDLVDEVDGWLDVVSYHDYAPLDSAPARLAKVRTGAEGRQVMVTEIGQTSWSLFAGVPSSPGKQAESLAARLSALEGADGLFLWTLHDFPEPDPEAVGHSPWVRGLQSQFGLIDREGREKPAATEVRYFFEGYTKESPHG